MRPDLVIFDCDGVLVDTETVTLAIVAENLTRHGLPMDEAEARKLFLGGTMMGVGDQARAMGAVLPDDWLTRIYDDIYDRLRQGVAPIPGIADVLDRVEAEGIPFCVGSNGSEEKMRITLGQHPGIFGRLAGRIFSAHTHGVAKPDPGLFLIAAAHHDVPPERCVVVDDSAPGCRAARLAGMRCFGFAEHSDGGTLLAEGARVFHRMSDLPALLGLPSAAPAAAPDPAPIPMP